jgi:hypothetical protein
MLPAPAPEEVAAEVKCDADEPGPPRLVGPRRRVTHRPDKRLLHQILGIRRIAREPVAQPPQKSFVRLKEVFPDDG